MQKCSEHDIKMTLEDLAHRRHSKYSRGTGNEETLPKSWSQAINLIESAFPYLMDFNTDIPFVELLSFFVVWMWLFLTVFLLFCCCLFGCVGPEAKHRHYCFGRKLSSLNKWEPNPVLTGFVCMSGRGCLDPWALRSTHNHRK